MVLGVRYRRVLGVHRGCQEYTEGVRGMVPEGVRGTRSLLGVPEGVRGTVPEGFRGTRGCWGYPRVLGVWYPRVLGVRYLRVLGVPEGVRGT